MFENAGEKKISYSTIFFYLGNLHQLKLSRCKNGLIRGVSDGARFKNKLMGVMVSFNLRKINTNQYYELDSLDSGIAAGYVNT